MSRFDPPSIKFRGAQALVLADVQGQKKPGQDVTGRLPCRWCKGTVSFTVFPSGKSFGRCTAACGIKWIE